VLELVSVTQTDQFSLFMMVDKDSSGQIDFAEFIQLIHLMGLAYNRNIKKLRRESLVPINDTKAAEVLSHGFGSTGNFLHNYMAAHEEGNAPPQSSDSENEEVLDDQNMPIVVSKSGNDINRHMSVADAAALSILQGDSENMERKKSATLSDIGKAERDKVHSSSSQADSERRSRDERSVISVVSDVSKEEAISHLIQPDSAEQETSTRGHACGSDNEEEEEVVVAYCAESVIDQLDGRFDTPEPDVKPEQLGEKEFEESVVANTLPEQKDDAVGRTSGEDTVHAFSALDGGEMAMSALRLQPLGDKKSDAGNRQAKYCEQSSGNVIITKCYKRIKLGY
jgi:hypothetical protein